MEAFGLGTDYALYHKSYNVQADPAGNNWSPAWENLGGDLTSTPVVVSPAADRVDIFALGPDQGMLHRMRTGTAWSRLGRTWWLLHIGTGGPAGWPGHV